MKIGDIKMEKEKLTMGMDDEIAMHEIINQTSIDKQEDVHDALAGYNNVEEVVEQDLLRIQFDRVDEDFEIHEVFAVDSVDVGDMVENLGDNIMEKNCTEKNDFIDWRNTDDSLYYNDNLDIDQQCSEI